MDSSYGSNVVRQLNSELRQGRYSEKLFARATGKSLDELWAEFQKTPAFTPVAAEANKLYNALGYVDGKPPRGVRARFAAYLKEKGEADELNRVEGELNGKPVTDILLLYAVYQYFLEGTTAAEFLERLGDKGELPGFAKGEPREISFGMSDRECDCEAYPWSRTFSCTKKGDSDTYRYTVLRESKDAPWKLQKAWRTRPDGRVVEEFAVP